MQLHSYAVCSSPYPFELHLPDALQYFPSDKIVFPTTAPFNHAAFLSPERTHLPLAPWTKAERERLNRGLGLCRCSLSCDCGYAYPQMLVWVQKSTQPLLLSWTTTYWSRLSAFQNVRIELPVGWRFFITLRSLLETKNTLGVFVSSEFRVHSFKCFYMSNNLLYYYHIAGCFARCWTCAFNINAL